MFNVGGRGDATSEWVGGVTESRVGRWGGPQEELGISHSADARSGELSPAL